MGRKEERGGGRLLAALAGEVPVYVPSGIMIWPIKVCVTAVL